MCDSSLGVTWLDAENSFLGTRTMESWSIWCLSWRQGVSVYSKATYWNLISKTFWDSIESFLWNASNHNDSSNTEQPLKKGYGEGALCCEWWSDYPDVRKILYSPRKWWETVCSWAENGHIVLLSSKDCSVFPTKHALMVWSQQNTWISSDADAVGAERGRNLHFTG